jgi:hypothetical protein
MQKNSEFTEIVNFYLHKLDESGTQHKLEQKWTYRPADEFGFPKDQTLGRVARYTLIHFTVANC